jgi:hypothetical protein
VGAQRAGGAGADRGDARAGQRACVAAAGRQSLEQQPHAVGRGQADQVVAAGVQRDAGVDRLDPDRGRLQDLRAERAQPRGQAAGLRSRARHGDAAAGERPVLEPAQPLLAQAGDRPDERDRRRPDRGRGRLVGDRLQRRDDGALTGQRAALDHGRRLVGGAAAGDQLLGDSRQLLDAHVEDERPGERGERGPVDRGLGLGRVLVAGDQRDGARAVAVRDRDARVGRGRDAGGHAGHDLERDAGGAQDERLLAAAPEDERVAALEPHDELAGAAVLDQQPVDLVLGHRRPAALLADVDQLGAGACAVERGRGDQAVVEDHVGLRDQLERAGGQQAGIAGTGADEVDAAG